MKSKKHERANRRLVFIAFMLLCMSALMIGIAAAFFSDTASNAKTMQSGSLRINAEYVYKLNGMTVSNEPSAFDPGDVLTITINVENRGTKSAWIRDVVSFTAEESLLPFLEVYYGEYTKSELLDSEFSGESVPLLGDGFFATQSKVIDGYSTNGEKETEGGDELLRSDSYTLSLTVFFLPNATNDAQEKELTISFFTQAIQYRNNSTLPTESDWSAIMA